MDTGAKVIIVNCETLLEILHAFLEVLHLFVAHAHIIERICLRWTLVWVFSLDLDSFFKGSYCKLPLRKLVVDLALKEESLRVVFINLNGFDEQLLAFLNILLSSTLLEENTSKLYHDIRVLRKQLVRLCQVLNSLLNALPASYNGPAKAKLNLALDVLLKTILLRHTECFVVF